jgi:hypothetical protein
VPGLGALNTGGSARVSSVSCAPAGNCEAGGSYKVPGLSTLHPEGDASAGSVSCPSAGHCVAGGSYQDRSFNFQGFLVSEH